MKKSKKQYNKVRQQFLLDTFFSDFNYPDAYEFKVVGEYVLVKQWNQSHKGWDVAIWKKEVWDRIKNK